MTKEDVYIVHGKGFPSPTETEKKTHKAWPVVVVVHKMHTCTNSRAGQGRAAGHSSYFHPTKFSTDRAKQPYKLGKIITNMNAYVIPRAATLPNVQVEVP